MQSYLRFVPLKKNLPSIHKTDLLILAASSLISSYVSLSQFASLEKAKEVEEFFATRSKPSMARTLKQSIERVHINATWVESVRKEDNLTQLVAQLSRN